MKQQAYVLSLMTCLIAGFVVSGCSNSKDETPPPSGADDELTDTLNDEVLQQLEGIYEQRGYGNIFEYAENRTTLFSITENTCLEIAGFQGLAGLSQADVAQTRYQLQGDQLSLAIPGDAFITRYQRLEELPARCDDSVASDAQGVFDYVWATFDEYYAFFDLHDVDWPAEYARLTPRVGSATDDMALFGLLSDLISPIDDDHVFLANNDEFFSPAVRGGSNSELRRGFEAQSETTDFAEYANSIFDQLKEVVVSQLDEGSVAEVGPLIWGTALDGAVGYIFVESMAGYVLDEDGDSDDNASTSQDLAAANALMDIATAELADTSRLVIDVRFNGGGHDSISLDFAQRFVSERQLVLSKTARSRDYTSEPVQAWLEPSDTGAYLNPVTVITGADSTSATEIFVIAMNQLPQVSLLGETTAGALSDVLQKPLPNRWVVALSNEVYLDAAGVSYEGVGVSPDEQIPVFRIDDIEAGTDPALERALELELFR